MLQSLWATVQDGTIQLSEHLILPEGTRVLVTILPEGEDQFWRGASQESLAAVWDNTEDDAYAE